MFQIRLADLQIQIDHMHDLIKSHCDSYIVSDGHPDITVTCNQSALDTERRIANDAFSDDYLETLAVYRMIGEQLPCFDGFIFHAAVIEVNGKAYAFAAKSGTGKSTHIRHWRTLSDIKATPVNGDKPIFRFIDNTLHACGTPWAGKEGWQRNTIVPLAGICFLEQGKTDQICRLSASDALKKSLQQIYLPVHEEAAKKCLRLMEKMLREVPLWNLQCTDSIRAAEVASNAMIKKA